MAEQETNYLTAGHASAPPSVFSGTILLAEDNAVNRVLAVRLLQRRGYRVQTAKTGLEAVQAFRQEPFDVVLMDIQMPGMDGFEATAAIRAMKRGEQVLILALTAHALKGDRERCLEAGMDGYITKPIQAESMYDAIESARRNSRQSAEPVAVPSPA